MKDLIKDRGIPQRALDYLNEHTPPKSFRYNYVISIFSRFAKRMSLSHLEVCLGPFRISLCYHMSLHQQQIGIIFCCIFCSASGILDANKWKEFLVRPALPYVLRMLTGLVGGHSNTQVCSQVVQM